MIHRFYLIVILCIISEVGFSQISSSDTSRTILIPEVADTIQNPDTLFIMTKSPWGALARSAIVPGWGQFYNESYLKIPIVWGVLSWFAYNWIQNNREYINYRDLYISNPSTSNRRLREFYRDNRDLFAIYMGLTYAANLIDAYVDAHLFDFDVSEDPVLNTRKVEMKFYFGRL